MAQCGWTVETAGPAVDAELDALPADMIARFLRIVGLIEEHGPHHVGMPHVRPIEGKLWEMRMSGQGGIGRAIYVTVTGRRVVVVHAFIKKTQTTPRRAIETAMRRAREAGLL